MLIASITGCASAPKARYYTVNMTPSAKQAGKHNIDVDRLRTAESLAKRNILVKKTATELEYYASDEWVASLGDIVREKLEAEFGEDVHARKTYLLDGEILSFQQEDTATGADAYIKLSISIREANGSRYEQPLFEHVYEARVTAGAATPVAVVEALGKGLEAIAADIVAEVNQLP